MRSIAQLTLRVTTLAASLTAIGCSDAVTATRSTEKSSISLTIVSGTAQSGVVGTELPLPLVVTATDSKGKLIPGIVVNYRVTGGGGSMYAGSASTDSKGLAADYWTLGSSTAQAQTVEVRAVLPTGEKEVYGVFTANPLPGAPTAMTVVGAAFSQWKLAGTAVPIRPSVRLTDQYGNPVGGVNVVFTPTAGGGSVIGGTVTTNAQGIATVGSWILGASPGANALTATVAALPGASSVFRAIGNNGSLYVSNEGANSITVFAAGSTGNATPAITIQGANTGLNSPEGVAIDGSGNLHVANSGNNTVTTFALGATGNATPSRTIGGSNTGLTSPEGIATDAAGNIYVSNQFENSILVFAAGANGNVAPIRTIAGGGTGLSRPMGMTVNASDNLYVVNLGIYGGICCNGTISVFAPGATGNATPVSTIAGSSDGMFNSLGITFDAAGTVYVSDFGNTDSGPSNDGTAIVAFAAGLSGTVTPTSRIAGVGQLSEPLGLAIDASGGLFVANFGSSTISIYAPGASGNAVPTAAIAGANTGLNRPAFITF